LLRAWASAAAALLAGLALLGAGLTVMGYDAGAALAALGRGAFGSWYAIGSTTLVRAVPLIIIGLGLSVAFRAGALNIGGEGQFYAGAVAATWIGLIGASWPAPLGLGAAVLVGAVAGIIWVLVPIALRLRFGVLEVITTLLLNFVAENLVSLLVQGPLQEAKGIYPQSDQLAASMRLAVLPGTRLHLGFPLALLAGVLLWIGFSRTRLGFQLRAVGEAPLAAMIAGRIRVGRMVGIGLAVSAGLAGLAGGLEVTGVSYALFQNLSPGYGFTAIAVALIARLHPLGVVVAGIGFGALEAGASAMQRDANVPAVAVYVVQATIILLAVLSANRASLARAEAAA
jgi:simple sugar transport system permease protein